MSIIPFPSRHAPAAPDVSALVFVGRTLLPELADTTPRLGEPLADYFARRDAAADILDDLLEEVALAADEAELLGGAA